jgi:hypothetical protein
VTATPGCFFVRVAAQGLSEGLLKAESSEFKVQTETSNQSERRGASIAPGCRYLILGAFFQLATFHFRICGRQVKRRTTGGGWLGSGPEDVDLFFDDGEVLVAGGQRGFAMGG